ncbi:MAG: sigma-70 family RNA polymerase sigma factor [Flavobacteriaceae bacterium]|nr:sigma-70 family RNA polymerase sigma factor [Flavobacteriaceae bacterium]
MKTVEKETAAVVLVKTVVVIIVLVKLKKGYTSIGVAFNIFRTMQLNIEAIWAATHEAVYAFALKKLQDVDLAKDITQEVYLTLLDKQEQLQDTDKIKSWLLTVTYRKCMDVFRLKQKNYGIAAEESEKIISLAEEAHDVQDCMQGILNQMPEKYATPLRMVSMEGLKQQQIAERMNLPLTTVKTRILRAKKMLAQGYIDCCDFRYNDKGYLVGAVKSKADCKVCR